MQTESSIEIDRPIAEVFDYTTSHVAEWSLTVVEEAVLETRPEGVGSTFRTVTEEKGRRLEFQGVVTRHEPPEVSAVSLKGSYFDIDVVYRFEDLSGRTRVTQQADVRGKGLFRAMLFLLGWLARKSSCKAQEKELANLKRLLESRPRPA